MCYKMPRGKKKVEKKVKKGKNVKKKNAKSSDDTNTKIFKKRGRKPKGGKIISKSELQDSVAPADVPNIILHLKCSSKDLDTTYAASSAGLNAFNSYSVLRWKNIQEKPKPALPPPSEELEPTNKVIWEKLKELEKQLHYNNVIDKKSSCFFCTYSFNNPPVYIPKQERNGIIETYGCFCSPECACAYLTGEHIDASTYWERFALLNNIYGKIFNYETNIKPAPNPHYTLERYYGNLTINEYRKLLKNDRILMVVEKPLTKILPELHDEKNEMPNIHTNLLNGKVHMEQHYRLKRRTPQFSKKKILTSTFNFK